MATYDELLAQYNALPAWGNQKQQFLNRHPKFKARLQAGGEPGSGKAATDEAAAPIKCPPGYHAEKNFVGAWVCVPDAPAGGQPPSETETSKEETPEEEETDRPPKPTVPPALAADGWDYVWDEDSKQWVLTQTAKPPDAFNNDLYDQFKRTLEAFGLTPTEDFLRRAVLEDWSEDTFMIRMREQDWYLANPLFRANLQRAKDGKRFMSELEVLSFAESAKEMARRYGYQEPPDSYLALSLTTKGNTTKSLAELESKIIAWQRLEAFGEPIKAYAEQALRVNLSDQDLFEFFDPDITDPEWVEAFKYAEYQGRPILLGFERRSREEARAYEMLGYTPDQVNELFKTARTTKFDTQRLATLEADLLTGMDPARIREVLKGHEDLVVQADVLQLPEARRKLQELLLRERARWRTGGTPVGAQGQLLGLLGAEEKASFG